MNPSKRIGAIDSNEPVAKQIRPALHLTDTVIFLFPCAHMFGLRRRLLLPGITYNGGEVTKDPNAATHCVITPFPVDSARLKDLRIQNGIPTSCKKVPESFLFE